MLKVARASAGITLVAGLPTSIVVAQGLLAEPLDAGTAHFDASNLEFTTMDVGNPATTSRL
jgi:hypothetical protein